MKNLDILVLEYFFLKLTLPWKLRQGIICHISSLLTIVDLKIVTKELLGLTNLTGARTFCIYELTRVDMVRKDENFVFAVL